jgi:hypothetical protein
VIRHSGKTNCSVRDMCLVVPGVVEVQSCIARCFATPSVGRIGMLVRLLTIAICRGRNPALAASLIVIYSANTRSSEVACLSIEVAIEGYVNHRKQIPEPHRRLHASDR